MSDHFSRIPVSRLLHWILSEYKHNTIFGIHRDLFFPGANIRGTLARRLQMRRYHQILETPLGVAAGPHSQMAQNIISAWLMGSRYIELKTIQTLDELSISKPCIDMEDEGYNCEWSQELKCEDSFDEYLNAWVIIHVLKHLLGHHSTETGCIFNMSVGYNMEGILQPNVQSFLSKISNAKKEIEQKVNEVKAVYPAIVDLNIPERVSNNVTLSTMHGCPPDEIEKIATYLLKEKKLHTTIKLNPTLLGAERLREILNNQHQFPIEIPDQAFDHDLKFEDAVAMIDRLEQTAKQEGVAFGLKLTNTLEAKNRKKIFPDKENMSYMSGRALLPISVNVAAKLQNHFKGTLDISYSGGADCFTIRELIACGFKPITVCSDILKPGGYGRLKQYLEHLSDWNNLEINLAHNEVSSDQLAFLNTYADKVITDHAFTKTAFSWFTIKTDRPLESYDCISAPCVSTCPSTQEIPAYMRAVASSNFNLAHEIIMKTNPFPGVTGLVCDHSCQSKCTRQNYDSPLQIREIKRFAEQAHDQEIELRPGDFNEKRVAIIGAGPSGLSAAYILRINGFEVDIFEARNEAGGMVSDTIPAFRLTDQAIQRDLQRILKLGARIHYNLKIDSNSFSGMKTSYDFIYISIGASRAKKLGIPGENSDGVFDQLAFLRAVRENHNVLQGKNTIIIGGGNSAIDAARTASRLIPPDGNVTLLYRRSVREMPAEIEEIEALKQEKVKIMELVSPLEIGTYNGKVTSLRCQRMELGEPDASGRRRPIPIAGNNFEIPVDTLISAIGQEVDLSFLEISRVDPATHETNIENTFLGGDAFRGASTIIQAVADGIRAANGILAKVGLTPNEDDSCLDSQVKESERQSMAVLRILPVHPKELPLDDRRNFKIVRESLSPEEAVKEASRCLSCDQACDVCVTVCPNRANISYEMPLVSLNVPIVQPDESGYRILGHDNFRIKQRKQVLNIGDFCNECGNCTTFCPTRGRPFRDKPKFYLSRKSFDPELNGYFFDHKVLESKSNGEIEHLAEEPDCFIFRGRDVEIKISKEKFELLDCQFPTNRERSEIEPFSLRRAVEMAILFQQLNKAPFVETAQA